MRIVRHVLVEKPLPLVICRPSAVAADIPAGDPRIRSGSKGNAVGHHAVRFLLRCRAHANVERRPISIRRPEAHQVLTGARNRVVQVTPLF
jgi:hypothetical protein